MDYENKDENIYSNPVRSIPVISLGDEWMYELADIDVQVATRRSYALDILNSNDTQVKQNSIVVELVGKYGLQFTFTYVLNAMLNHVLTTSFQDMNTICDVYVALHTLHILSDSKLHQAFGLFTDIPLALSKIDHKYGDNSPGFMAVYHLIINNIPPELFEKFEMRMLELKFDYI
jgi:hypothetical protein